MFAKSKRERKGRRERKGTQSSAREYLLTAAALVSPCVAEGSHRQQPPSFLRFFAVFALFAFEL
jgi:hypothetical protein